MIVTPEQLAELHARIDEWAATLTGNQPKWPGDPTAGRPPTWEHLFDYQGEPDWNTWESIFWWNTPPENFSGCALVQNRGLEWNLNHRFQPAKTLRPFRVEDGRLRIIADRMPAHMRAQMGYNLSNSDVDTMGEYTVTSGAIHTRNSFAAQYGYFEIDAQMPHAFRGGWPAGWLRGINNRHPEVDIFEVIMSEAFKFYTTVHLKTGKAGIETWTDTTQRHKYGVLIEPGKITAYLDRVPRTDIIPAVIDEPMAFILNLAIGGQWPEQSGPVDMDALPAEMQVWALRHWEL